MVPCRVELGHANVCKGVELSWPKRMFDKANFSDLNAKEKQIIRRDMERKAVLLHQTYVDGKRLAARCRERTRRALAPYSEWRYRKNLFERITALGKDRSAQLSDSDADEADMSRNSSVQTVINTGKTGTQKSSAAAKQSDIDCHSDIVNENTEYRSANRTSTIWKSKPTYTITQNFTSDDEIIANEYEVPTTEHHEYNVEMSESEAATSPSRDTNSETQSHQGEHVNAFNDLVNMSPSVKRAWQRTNEMPDGNTDEESNSEVDTIDFCTDEMDGRTSTP